MQRSLKKMVGFRIAAALAAVLLFSFMVIMNGLNIEKAKRASAEANTLLGYAQKAETAHYKWASNLSNALYAGTEFTGSTDPTGCVLGQWIYGEAGTKDKEILALRDQLKPLHEELHQSAIEALDLFQNSPEQAQTYYHETIQSNLGTIVGILDEVVEKGTALNESSAANMQTTIRIMHATSVIGLTLTIICLASLVLYLLKHVIKPLLTITDKIRPLQEGRLELDLHYDADDEIGNLATILKHSLEQTHIYVDDINRMLHTLSTGDFDVSPSVSFIGDFRSIEHSITEFTNALSLTIAKIKEAEGKVSVHAEHLSNSAQSLASGATRQASAVQELYATLDDLSQSAQKNIHTATAAQENANLTGQQVNLSSQQMEQLVAAMEDISNASGKIEKIISTIEDIAFQTNILALNAAVEAARAGTAGKGFAVVSSEVRSLATRSEQAAKATKELIENSVQAAERGSQIVNEVSSTLQKTLELVRHSNDAIGEISTAVSIEATAISEVTSGLGQISEVVQTNSASSEESAAVSTELFDQVRLLQDQTSRFKLKQHSYRQSQDI